MPALLLSFQYGWGERGQPAQPAVDVGDKYVFPKGDTGRPALEVAEPVVVPGSGPLAPLAPGMFEDLKEYLNWNSAAPTFQRGKAKGRPVIGLVLQRQPHLFTGNDEAHYRGGDQETGNIAAPRR